MPIELQYATIMVRCDAPGCGNVVRAMFSYVLPEWTFPEIGIALCPSHSDQSDVEDYELYPEDFYKRH